MEIILFIGFVVSIIFFIIEKKKYHELLAEMHLIREKLTFLDKKERQCAALQQELIESKVRYAAIETTLREREDFYQKKIAEIGDMTVFCKESFRALSIETLTKNNQAFLELASAKLEKYQKEIQMNSSHNAHTVKSLFVPICEQLEKMQLEMKKLEVERKIDHTKIQTQLTNMIESERELQKETSNLKKVFRSPNLRGRWGEIQLKRVLEIVGLRAYCDFEEQISIKGEDEISRPDVIVRLPIIDRWLSMQKCHSMPIWKRLKRMIPPLKKQSYRNMPNLCVAISMPWGKKSIGRKLLQVLNS